MALHLKWGDAEIVTELVQRMGENRPGIGGAAGPRALKRAAAQIDGGQDFAIQVKGLELPFHHPRALRGLELAYATLPRGASHNEEGVVFDFDDTTYEAWVGQIIHNIGSLRGQIVRWSIANSWPGRSMPNTQSSC